MKQLQRAFLLLFSLPAYMSYISSTALSLPPNSYVSKIRTPWRRRKEEESFWHHTAGDLSPPSLLHFFKVPFPRRRRRRRRRGKLPQRLG